MEKERNVALIINHPGLNNVGGIEKYIYNLVKYCIKTGIRVIWMSYDKPRVSASFKEVMLSNSVERVPVKELNWYWYQYDSIPLEKDERYVIFACTPICMCTSQDIMLRYSDYDFFPVYAMANTTGAFYFLECYFNTNFFSNKIYSTMRKMMLRWEKYDAIRFFAEPQADALERNYGIEIKNKQSKVLKGVEEIVIPNFDYVGKRFKKDGNFDILTVGRLCFPHKGYMLGLINTFGMMKKEHPQLRLHIVGSGQDERLLMKEIEKQPKCVQDSIFLYGEVSPDQLDTFYQQASLNIGVAGAALGGALAGTLTVVARNYCAKGCEVYGFFNNCPNMITSTEEGMDVQQYILQTLEMPEEEYLSLCKSGFEEAKKIADYNPNYLFESTKNLLFEPSKSEVRKMKVIKRLIKINHYLKLF